MYSFLSTTWPSSLQTPIFESMHLTPHGCKHSRVQYQGQYSYIRIDFPWHECHIVKLSHSLVSNNIQEYVSVFKSVFKCVKTFNTLWPEWQLFHYLHPALSQYTAEQWFSQRGAGQSLQHPNLNYSTQKSKILSWEVQGYSTLFWLKTLKLAFFDSLFWISG